MIDGVCVGVIITVEQEDATYPPSVEDCPRTADNVPQKAAVINDILYAVQDKIYFLSCHNDNL